MVYLICAPVAEQELIDLEELMNRPRWLFLSVLRSLFFPNKRRTTTKYQGQQLCQHPVTTYTNMVLQSQSNRLGGTTFPGLTMTTNCLSPNNRDQQPAVDQLWIWASEQR